MSKEQYTIKEHFVPQFYLKEFTDTNGFLHCFDFGTSKHFLTRPKDFAYKKNLYETPWKKAHPKLGEFVLRNNIENTFSKYELEYANLLNRIKDSCIQNPHSGTTVLSKKDQELLCSFLANLLVRNPDNMQLLGLNQVPDDVKDTEEIVCIEYLLQMLNLGDIDSLLSVSYKQAMLTEELPEAPLSQFVESVKKYPVQFLYAENGTFLTSTCPVVYSEDPTIPGEDKTCFYAALTAKIAVLLGNYKEFRDCSKQMVLLPEKDVNSFNELFVKHAKQNQLSLIGNSKEEIERYVTRMG